MARKWVRMQLIWLCFRAMLTKFCSRNEWLNGSSMALLTQKHFMDYMKMREEFRKLTAHPVPLEQIVACPKTQAGIVVPTVTCWLLKMDPCLSSRWSLVNMADQTIWYKRILNDWRKPAYSSITVNKKTPWPIVEMHMKGASLASLVWLNGFIQCCLYAVSAAFRCACQAYVG